MENATKLDLLTTLKNKITNIIKHKSMTFQASKKII